MTNKNWTIFTSILWVIIFWVFAYAMFMHSKVNAQQEIIDKQQPIVDTASRISELEDMIKITQEQYQIAEQSKRECEIKWNKEMDKAHEKADWFRKEQAELMGLIMNR